MTYWFMHGRPNASNLGTHADCFWEGGRTTAMWLLGPVIKLCAWKQYRQLQSPLLSARASRVSELALLAFPYLPHPQAKAGTGKV